MFRTIESFDFRAWREGMHLTQAKGAEALCTHLRTFQKWEGAGEAPALAVKHAQLLERLRSIV